MCKYCDRINEQMLSQDPAKLMFMHKNEQQDMRVRILTGMGAHPEKITSGECIQWVVQSHDIAPRGFLDNVVTHFF
jgi:hypothetical protein